MPYKNQNGLSLRLCMLCISLVLFTQCTKEDIAISENTTLYSQGYRIQFTDAEFDQLSQNYTISKNLDRYLRKIPGFIIDDKNYLSNNGDSSTGSCSCGKLPSSNDVSSFEPVLGLAGRILFYDTRLSLSNTTSCASCHKQEHAFADNAQFSLKDDGTYTKLNTPSLSYSPKKSAIYGHNVNYKNLGHAIEQNIIEYLGHTELSDVIAKIKDDEDLKLLSSLTANNRKIDEEFIIESLIAFINSNNAFDSYYDRVKTDISINKKRAFITMCSNCHSYDHERFNYNTQIDGGITKSKSLRNISLTAPYLFDGSASDFEDVINHHINHEILVGKVPTVQEIKELKDYIKFLEDGESIESIMYSNPHKN